MRSESRRTRNSEMPDSLVEYCRAHPDQRFWQALRNWSGWQHVLVSNDSDFVLSKAAGWKNPRHFQLGARFLLTTPGLSATRRLAPLQVELTLGTLGLVLGASGCWRPPLGFCLFMLLHNPSFTSNDERLTIDRSSEWFIVCANGSVRGKQSSELLACSRQA